MWTCVDTRTRIYTFAVFSTDTLSNKDHLIDFKENLTFSLTFSNDAGATTEKQTRKTSVCGYDKGLSLS